MMKRFIYWTFVVFLVSACICFAAPQPAIVQTIEDWTVDARFEHPQQISIKMPGDRKTSRFWYTIITLTNNTGSDVDFYPAADLMTDTFQVLPSCRNVSRDVFEKIKTRHQSQYPFLESFQKTSSKILQGRDNTKDIAIIWPDFDAKAKSIKLFITGLSNETVAIDHPIAKDEKGKPVKVFLRKTLELDYSFGGDVAFRSDARLLLKAKRWVMR